MDKGKVQNPLTIIAIFAGLAEVAGTAVLLGLPLEIQKVFMWFVMGLPILLVIVFFLVLVFKPEALYAPSDYKNEQLFVDILMGRRKVDSTIWEAAELLEEVKEEIQDVKSSKKLEEAMNKIEIAKQNSDELANQLTGFITVKNDLTNTQRDIIKLLKENQQNGMTVEEFSNKLNLNKEATLQSLLSLEFKGILRKELKNMNKYSSKFYMDV